MEQITQFSYTQLTNGNASQVYGRLAENYMHLQQPLTTMGDTPLRNALMSIVLPKIVVFNDASGELDENVRQAVASVYTRSMNVYERERDRDLKLAERIVRNGMMSSNTDVAESANHVDVAWKLYGDIVNRQTDEQTRIARALFRDLAMPEMQVHVQRIPGLEAALQVAEASNNAFADNFDNRLSDREKIITGLTRQIRFRADAAALDVATAINVVASVFDNPALNDIIKVTNTILDQASLTLAARKRGLSVKAQNAEGEPKKEEE